MSNDNDNELTERVEKLERQVQRDSKRIALLRKRQRLELETIATIGGVAASIQKQTQEIRQELEAIDQEEAEEKNQGARNV